MESMKEYAAAGLDGCVASHDGTNILSEVCEWVSSRPTYYISSLGHIHAHASYTKERVSCILTRYSTHTEDPRGTQESEHWLQGLTHSARSQHQHKPPPEGTLVDTLPARLVERHDLTG